MRGAIVSRLKLISWNLGGIKARAEQGALYKYIKEHNADIYCFQETRAKAVEAERKCLSLYNAYACESVNSRYGGAVIYYRPEPISINSNPPDPMSDEGRVIIFEYECFYLINIYLPNEGDYKQKKSNSTKWRDWLYSVTKILDEIKPVIICGDFNIATYYKESRRISENRGSAGFEAKDRQYLQQLLELGFTDVLNHQFKTEAEMLAYFERLGDDITPNFYRLDYIFISKRINCKIISADIHADMRRYNCHHLPLEIVMDTNNN